MLVTLIVSAVMCLLPCGLGKGVVNIQGPGRMEATPGEYPYFVFIKDRRSNDLITSGVLIRPRIVLTIGYNFLSKSSGDIKVVLGTHDRSMKEPSRQEIRVSHIAINYELIKTINAGATGDIALLRLVDEATRDKRVKTLGLDNIVSSNSDDEDLDSCYVPGYGLIEWDEYIQRWPKKLQKYKAQMRTPKICEAVSGDGNYGRKKWLCSVNTDLTGTCMYDGGNPLMCEKDGKTKLYGLTSGGTRYCSLGYSFYTRVSTYYEWIKKTTRGLETI